MPSLEIDAVLLLYTTDAVQQRVAVKVEPLCRERRTTFAHEIDEQQLAILRARPSIGLENTHGHAPPDAVRYQFLVLLLGLQGHHHAQIVAEMQPAKLAAMESHWETGTHVPMYLLTWPDQANRTNSIQALPIPSLLSLLAFNSPSAEVKGLDAFPADDIPPVLPTFLSFRFMVACAGLFVLLAIAAWWWRKDLENHPLLMKALIYVIPLPYLGIMAGWAVAEIGRQPWIVYGLMRTSDAVSPVPTSSVGLSLAAFIVIYTFLGILDIYLLRKYAKKGPEAAPEAQA